MNGMSRGWPDFLLIGAPKAGTTAVHAALAGHPRLFLTKPKEPKYFLCGEQPPPPQHGPGDAHSAKEWVWDRQAYHRLFDAAPAEALKGESTPLYLADHDAHRRIAENVPGAKLLVVVRDPVDRAYSNWTHLWADGLEPVGDFMEACGLEEERVAAGWAPFWRYTWQGLYGRHLQHLLSVFPAAQVHVLRYRDLVDTPSATLDRICAFLGVETGVIDRLPDANVSSYIEPSLVNRSLQTMVRHGAAAGRHLPPEVWRSASRPFTWLLKRRGLQRPTLAETDRERLHHHFVEDIALLERLTGESFSHWLSERETGPYALRKAS
jgi:hypothetical protein